MLGRARQDPEAHALVKRDRAAVHRGGNCANDAALMRPDRAKERFVQRAPEPATAQSWIRPDEVTVAFVRMRCGSKGECESGESLVVAADATCPSPGVAEEAFRAAGRQLVVDRLLATTWTAAVTLCWYRAQSAKESCNHHYTRAHWVELGAPPATASPSYALSCDADGLLYGEAFIVAVTTPNEAVAATAVGCPITIAPDDDALQFHPDLALGEFVGSDFFPAQKVCSYSTHYPCGGGAGIPSGGLQ